MNSGRARQDRVQALGRILRHYDPPQLYFQLAEIAADQTYLRHGVKVLQDDVVLDVGANVGVAAAFFALLCGARLVHSFEPVKPLFELLRENVTSLPACVVHEYGLASTPGRFPIDYYPGAAAMSGLYVEPRRDRALVRRALLNRGLTPEEADQQLRGRYEPQTLICELRTLSAFLREEGLARVNLLKIDVERAELEVLGGIQEADWPKIEQLVIEVHDEDGRLAGIAAALAGRGYRVATEQDPALRGTSVRMLYARRP